VAVIARAKESVAKALAAAQFVAKTSMAAIGNPTVSQAETFEEETKMAKNEKVAKNEKKAATAAAPAAAPATAPATAPTTAEKSTFFKATVQDALKEKVDKADAAVCVYVEQNDAKQHVVKVLTGTSESVLASETLHKTVKEARVEAKEVADDAGSVTVSATRAVRIAEAFKAGDIKLTAKLINERK